MEIGSIEMSDIQSLNTQVSKPESSFDILLMKKKIVKFASDDDASTEEQTNVRTLPCSVGCH